MTAVAEAVKSEAFEERQIEIDGWPMTLTSYRMGDKYVCQAADAAAGACLARFAARTLEEAEAQATSKARRLLGKTRRRSI